MPTADPSNVLFKIAHPDLYEHNPFNILNLPVTATAKDIRRRKEDIEAAFDAGTETDEFASILPLDRKRKVPTRDIISSAFASLDNPEERLAWTLFWFWETPEIALPTDRHGRVVGNANGRISDQLCLRWMEQGLKNEGPEPAIALHNAAVEQHMICFDIENRLASGRDTRPTPEFIAGFWKRAILFWNRSVNSDDVWHALVDYATDLNDSRVDYKTVRRFRDQFAFAFDQINAELAIDYARCGREADAKRQVEYMKLSQPDSDDVEGTFDNAFAGLLRQTEAIVQAARDEVQKNPKNGLAKANEILSLTAEPLRVSRIIFETGAPIRDAIVTTIFTGIRSCLVSYGNETHEWDNCLAISRQLASLAETDEQKKRAKDDSDVLSKLSREKSLQETCWCCKSRIESGVDTSFKEVKLWGQMKFGDSIGQVTFRTLTIRVPMCHHCQSIGANVSDYPDVRKATAEGWKIGDGPSQNEIAAFWGIPTSSRKFSPQPTYSDSHKGSNTGCIIGAIFLFLIILAAVSGNSSGRTTSKSSYHSTTTTYSSSYNSALRAEQEQKAREEKALWESRRQTPPAHGTVRRYHPGFGDSPFKLTTSAGGYYFVKVVNSSTGSTILDLFVEGGRSIEINIPSGTYEIRYATGKEWYGYQYLFGPETTYSKTNRNFTFSYGSGYELTLYKVANGNLSTRSIQPKDF